MSSQRVAVSLGLDLSTTGLAVVARDATGDLDFVAVDNLGATQWRDQPAFDLEPLPTLIGNALSQLQERRWSFQPCDDAALSFSVRQHDMVPADESGRPLIPALSWQCNAATEEVRELQALGVEETVGKIEPRFILPKLVWTLKQSPELRQTIRHVMTTGDYIAWMLTGQRRLSTSDALSNGLLYQQTKQRAVKVFQTAGLNPEWFPEEIASNAAVGSVSPLSFHSEWDELRERLSGWTVVAGLGDNHASAAGCGLRDAGWIVVSAGSSGTINRLCEYGDQLQGNAVTIEYYDHRLLLMMLHDCAVWYNRFRKQFCGDDAGNHTKLNELALSADLDKLIRIEQTDNEATELREAYPADWETVPLNLKVASTQFSIAAELLRLLRQMLAEVDNTGRPVEHFALTGGMSQSPFFQELFAAGVQLLCEEFGGSPSVHVSAREGTLATQTAALGALVNAEQAARYNGHLEAAMKELCPLKDCRSADEDRQNKLIAKLRPIVCD